MDMKTSSLPGGRACKAPYCFDATLSDALEIVNTCVDDLSTPLLTTVQTGRPDSSRQGSGAAMGGGNSTPAAQEMPNGAPKRCYRNGRMGYFTVTAGSGGEPGPFTQARGEPACCARAKVSSGF